MSLTFPRQGLSLKQDFDSLETKRNPIVSEYIYEGEVWMLSADAGVGKSTHTTNLAMALSSGSPVFSALPCEKKRVYYLQTEGDYEESIERMRFMSKKIPIDFDYLCWDSFRFLDLNILGMDDALIMRIEKTFQPEVIIIDPIYKLSSLDISTAQAALQIVRLCDKLKDRFNATIILIHHNTKETVVISEGKKFDKKHAYYGHSFLINHVNTLYAYSLDPETKSPVLTRQKGRGANNLEKVYLHYDPDTMTLYMEQGKGTALDRIRLYANTLKINDQSSTFSEVQKACSISTSYLRKYKTEGALNTIFKFQEGKQGKELWFPI